MEDVSDTGRPVEFSRARQAVARRMVDSKRDAPHFYASTELEMDAAVDHVEKLSASAEGVRVTITAILIRALRSGPSGARAVECRLGHAMA